MIDDGNLIPPLGTLTMAAIMQREGWEVRFYDERLDKDAVSNLIDFEPRIVGISAVTASILRGYDVASRIKEVLPQSIIVFGGPHPTVLAEDVSAMPQVDFVVAGEGEYALKELCQWYLAGRASSELDKINNLCYTNCNRFIRNEMRPFLSSEELDLLPMPAFHLLDIKKIFKLTKHGLFKQGSRVLPVMSSRGCPSQCTYCCRVMGSKIRYRDPQLLLKEIETMISTYAVDEIWFEDDNFTANPKRANLILDELIKKDLGIHIKFANGMRADGVDLELLQKMKKAGCYSISFGIESGSERVLALMKKNLSLEKTKENIKLARSLGFLVGANCILGYPGETKEDIETSLDYFMKLDLDSMAIVNLIPFPGTEVRKLCEERGYLTPLADDWNNYIFDINKPRILIETEHLTANTLKRLINKAYFRMYLNPLRIFRILSNMKPKDIVAGTKIMLSKLLQLR